MQRQLRRGKAERLKESELLTKQITDTTGTISELRMAPEQKANKREADIANFLKRTQQNERTATDRSPTHAD